MTRTVEIDEDARNVRATLDRLKLERALTVAVSLLLRYEPDDPRLIDDTVIALARIASGNAKEEHERLIEEVQNQLLREAAARSV